MKIEMYQVDAFTTRVFSGNPAAVCPLDKWLPDDTLQKIAAENNLSETAFFVGTIGNYELRWFTPKTEVDLCGHATLAAAFVILTFLTPSRKDLVTFDTKSGKLEVNRQNNGLLFMNFPSRGGTPCEIPSKLTEGLGKKPTEVYLSRDYMAVFETEEEVESIKPNMELLTTLDSLGVIVTAPSKHYDFVSRFFAPKVGVPEDPVTGSAHCTLIPYWSRRLGKKTLTAYQLSARGGEVYCEDLEDRVKIGGYAVLYLRGTINI